MKPRTRLILAAAAALVALALIAVPARAALRESILQLDNSRMTGAAEGVGQTFTVTQSGYITQIDLWMLDTATGTLEIRVGGSPNGTLLYSKPVSYVKGGPNAFLISEPVRVNAGGQYTVLLSSDRLDKGDARFSEGDAYAGGTWWLRAVDRWKAPGSEHDLYFRVLIEDAPSGFVSSEQPPVAPGLPTAGDPAAFPTVNGQQACGLFSVDWHGVRIVDPDWFPACPSDPAALRVACLTDKGSWTVNTVSDDEIKDGLLYVTIKQSGTCGVFPR